METVQAHDFIACQTFDAHLLSGCSKPAFVSSSGPPSGSNLLILQHRRFDTVVPADRVLSRFCHGKQETSLHWFRKWFRIRYVESRGVAQPGSAPALGASRRLPKLLLILHTSNGFNNLGNLLFAQS